MTQRQGSSPRVRGTYRAWLRPSTQNRLIPAGAGNIDKSVHSRFLRRAHPRGCGEHSLTGLYGLGRTGSSPRVRGTCRVLSGLVPPWGLIPAGAGNILSISDLAFLLWAHPRGCGEHDRSSSSRAALGGSSPRVRGTSAA